MTRCRLPLFALVLVPAFAGCPKQTEAPDTVPVAGGDDREAAEAASGDEPVGSATSDSAPRTRGAGVWGPLGGLAPTAAPSSPGVERVAEPPTPAAPRDDFEVERVQFELDIGQLSGSPVWALVRVLVLREASGEERCALELLEQSQSIYGDVTYDVRGDILDMLLSIRTRASTADVLSCFQDAFNGGVAFEARSVGGRPGWASRGEGTGEGVLVEAEAGWWLLGLPDRAERELLSGRRPEEDVTFGELTGPLGPFAVRVTATPRVGVERSPFGDPEAGDPEACLAELWSTVTGLAGGLSVATAAEGGLAVRTGSPEAASEVRACLASVWEKSIPGFVEGFSAEEAASVRQLLGMSLEEALGGVSFETVSNFATARGSFPLAALLGILQLGM